MLHYGRWYEEYIKIVLKTWAKIENNEECVFFLLFTVKGQDLVELFISFRSYKMHTMKVLELVMHFKIRTNE